MCKTDANDVLRVIQLSVDHNTSNEDEVLRLSQLGLDARSLKQGPFLSSRCIGCYNGKAGYKDSIYLSSATSEPVLSTPEIVGPIPVDDSCRFLVLMSGGLCKTLQDIYSNETNIVNKEIIKIIVEQVRYSIVQLYAIILLVKHEFIYFILFFFSVPRTIHLNRRFSIRRT